MDTHEENANGEVTVERDGRQYGATYAVSEGMLKVKTHTESRSLALEGRDPRALARDTLAEIVDAQPTR